MTLIEVLITIVISSVAMMALAMPLVAERSFWGTGRRQTEAQRDAQMAMRAIARVAHESHEVDVFTSPGRTTLVLWIPCPTLPPPGSARIVFQGGPAFRNGSLTRTDYCVPGEASAVVSTLIDGNSTRSQVTEMAAEVVIPERLVRIRLEVTHRLRSTDPNEEDERLETELLLRNAPT